MAVLAPCLSTIHSFRRWIFTILTGLSMIVVIYLYKSAAATPKASPMLPFRLVKDDRPALVQNHSHYRTTKEILFNNTAHLFENKTSTRKSNGGNLRAKDLSEEDKCSPSCQASVQRMRQQKLTNACAFASNRKFRRRVKIWDAKGNLRADQLKRLNHLYPIDNSELIYCSVPKDGCTSWKRILLALEGKIEDPNTFKMNVHPIFERKIKPLSSYTVSEAERRLRTYKKFLFVREPLQRMLSLFLDKSVAKGEFPFKEDQFEGFLNYILRTPEHGMAHGYSEHWTHATYLCLPCDIRYTFIGRLETSKRDFKYVLNNFVNQSFIQRKFPLINLKVHKTESTDPMTKNHHFSQVNNITLEKIYKKYELDYKMFSYDKPVYLQSTNR